MAHEIDRSNNRANIAYVGEVPWHGLGQKIDPDADLNQWRIAAGLNFELESAPVMYPDPTINGGSLIQVPERKVLVRSDTRDALAVVSNRYHVVQPAEVIEFYRDVVQTAGFTMDTAGSLNGGRKYWALAKIGQDARIMGQDAIEGYLLLATACDGTLATTAMFTSVRVVCNNTLGFAVQEGEAGSARQYLKIPHSKVFDPQAIKVELGLAERSWRSFVEAASAMATVHVSNRDAVKFLVDIMGDPEKPVEEQEDAKNLAAVMRLFTGEGKGSNLRSADGTAWGLVNSVTEWLDHHRATRTASARLDRAWFGDGAVLKRKAWDHALAMAA
jgi:phage/plasmid-like protein (TIGR03299 family)